jgi:hypothetical protein
MKRACYIIFITVLLCGVSFAVASGGPVDKGSILVLGMTSAGFASESGDLYENMDGDGLTSISFYPAGLYFFMPNLAIGASVDICNESQGDWSTTDITIGPEVAYFFNLEGSSIIPYVGASFGYMSDSWDDGTDNGTDDGFSFTGMGGAVLMAGNHVGFSGQLYVSQTSITFEGADESVSGTTFGVRFGVMGFIFSE